jgi:hypothetical protein
VGYRNISIVDAIDSEHGWANGTSALANLLMPFYSSAQNSCFIVLKCLQPSHSDFLYAKMITRHFTLVP